MLLLYLLPFQAAAVMFDLYERKIPNTVITGGLLTAGAYQWSRSGPAGVLVFAGGVLAPFLMLGVLHYFRMLGAGDIKLLMMAGGFLGLPGSIYCVFLSFLTASVFALILVVRNRNLAGRLHYLLDYLKNAGKGGAWTPYITRKETHAYLHFSVAVMIGSILVGGEFY